MEGLRSFPRYLGAAVAPGRAPAPAASFRRPPAFPSSAWSAWDWSGREPSARFLAFGPAFPRSLFPPPSAGTSLSGFGEPGECACRDSFAWQPFSWRSFSFSWPELFGRMPVRPCASCVLPRSSSCPCFLRLFSWPSTPLGWAGQFDRWPLTVVSSSAYRNKSDRKLQPAGAEILADARPRRTRFACQLTTRNQPIHKEVARLEPSRDPLRNRLRR